MALKHSVNDSDTHFIIDPVTRGMRNEGSAKVSLVQGDHNSERFSFELPRMIEGHDMTQCDAVQVHFNNIDVQTKAQSKSFYTVTDMEISKDDPSKVVLTWLIAGQATKYVGSLNFVLRFSCFNEDGKPGYVWNTAVYSAITITDGIYNGDAIAEEYADILKEWELELKANQVVSLEQTQVGDGDGGLNVWTATFGDGRTAELKVKNGTRGDTGLIGSIETINGEPLFFFIGTKEQYTALPDAIKADHLFAIITDEDEPWVGSVTPVENGGTGATTALGAMQNLGLCDTETKVFVAETEAEYVQQVKNYVLTKCALDSKKPFVFNAAWRDILGQSTAHGTACATSTAPTQLALVLIHPVLGARQYMYTLTAESGTWGWKEVSVGKAKTADLAAKAELANYASTAGEVRWPAPEPVEQTDGYKLTEAGYYYIEFRNAAGVDGAGSGTIWPLGVVYWEKNRNLLLSLRSTHGSIDGTGAIHAPTGYEVYICKRLDADGSDA